jgi:hypothetical protein
MVNEETADSIKETMTTTIEVEKEVFLKFKALCVLNETTISGEIEKLLRKKVEQLARKDDNSIVATDE